MGITKVRELEPEDLPRIAEVSGGVAWKSNFERWNGRLADQKAGERVVLLAVNESGVLGYGSLLWTSCYAPFREAGIPEINDLVVAEAHRAQGIAMQLIRELEQRARARGCTQVGLGVGLYRDYGPAQRLYVRLGYVPDGHGVTHRGLTVPGGAAVVADDDLLLWLVKTLTSA